MQMQNKKPGGSQLSRQLPSYRCPALALCLTDSRKSLTETTHRSELHHTKLRFGCTRGARKPKESSFVAKSLELLRSSSSQNSQSAPSWANSPGILRKDASVLQGIPFRTCLPCLRLRWRSESSITPLRPRTLKL